MYGQNQHQLKMIDYIKEPDTSTFIVQTGCGKTHLVLELIEKEYNNHFDYIVIICPSFRETNKIYLLRIGSGMMIVFGL